ncbi:LOW QUALITY PROTEIN: cell surface glycoprotein 1 [Gorilla gorilla gorilla]|uniref:LOW QUALITY PROTEIN: cell surface glycoprotein 1 n=1 Tax=Gorilla gorilla gorilla TaxID=9595 RepID=UPI002445D621|nr:LOW QUALITY PROTEIN: cell surface glycoprotein 1 [Gorilla gorilla gorilla]
MGTLFQVGATPLHRPSEKNGGLLEGGGEGAQDSANDASPDGTSARPPRAAHVLSRKGHRVHELPTPSPGGDTGFTSCPRPLQEGTGSTSCPRPLQEGTPGPRAAHVLSRRGHRVHELPTSSPGGDTGFTSCPRPLQEGTPGPRAAHVLSRRGHRVHELPTSSPGGDTGSTSCPRPLQEGTPGPRAAHALSRRGHRVHELPSPSPGRDPGFMSCPRPFQEGTPGSGLLPAHIVPLCKSEKRSGTELQAAGREGVHDGASVRSLGPAPMDLDPTDIPDPTDTPDPNDTPDPTDTPDPNDIPGPH